MYRNYDRTARRHTRILVLGLVLVVFGMGEICVIGGLIAMAFIVYVRSEWRSFE